MIEWTALRIQLDLEGVKSEDNAEFAKLITTIKSNYTEIMRTLVNTGIN